MQRCVCSMQHGMAVAAVPRDLCVHSEHSDKMAV